MGDSSSSGSIGRITAPTTSQSNEEEVPKQPADENKKPTMVAKAEKQDVASNRDAYEKSKDSTPTKATRYLKEDVEKKSSSRQQANSSKSDEEAMFSSSAPNLRSASSTTKAASSSSTSVLNPEWAEFDRQILNYGGTFNVGSWMDINEICRWLANFSTDLEGNTEPNQLIISCRTLGDNDTKALADALKSNTTIKNISLVYSTIGAGGAKELAEALNGNTTLESLEIIKCQIDADGAKALADALKGDSALKSLNINMNAIGTDGVNALAEALKCNTTLKTLKLNDIAIDAGGFKALADALKVNMTLTRLEFDDPSDEDTIDMQEINAELEKNRQLPREKKEAKVALELINAELGKTDNFDALMYPREVMDQLVDQMVQAGLKDEVIELGNSIKPET